jgi:hypothetical protein
LGDGGAMATSDSPVDMPLFTVPVTPPSPIAQLLLPSPNAFRNDVGISVIFEPVDP